MPLFVCLDPDLEISSSHRIRIVKWENVERKGTSSLRRFVSKKVGHGNFKLIHNGKIVKKHLRNKDCDIVIVSKGKEGRFLYLRCMREITIVPWNRVRLLPVRELIIRGRLNGKDFLNVQRDGRPLNLNLTVEACLGDDRVITGHLISRSQNRAYNASCQGV